MEARVVQLPTRAPRARDDELDGLRLARHRVRVVDALSDDEAGDEPGVVASGDAEALALGFADRMPSATVVRFPEQP